MRKVSFELKEPIPHILLSAYACGPNRGSEIGLGWNWVINLARYCRITVITESEFRDETVGQMSALDLGHSLHFHFLDIGEKAREQCWNQGDWRFYSHYKKWQWRAYILSKRLIKAQNIDIVHQLNMIGYREPGYLWKLPLPFIWGPVGGHAQMPWRFLTVLGVRGALYHSFRNTVNLLQMNTNRRVKLAVGRAYQLIAATREDKLAIKKVHGKDSLIINETGSHISDKCVSQNPYSGRKPLRIVWCGKAVSRKALSLAMRAIAESSKVIDVEFNIVGISPSEDGRWKRLAKKLGIDSCCYWHGIISHGEALSLMGSCDCLLFTSLQEGTPHVVLESLGLGTPVICHNANGHGTCVDPSCGVSIPMIKPCTSVRDFSRAIERMGKDPAFLSYLSAGAISRSKELSWDMKARLMVSLYRQVLSVNSRA